MSETWNNPVWPDPPGWTPCWPDTFWVSMYGSVLIASIWRSDTGLRVRICDIHGLVPGIWDGELLTDFANHQDSLYTAWKVFEPIPSWQDSMPKDPV